MLEGWVPEIQIDECGAGYSSVDVIRDEPEEHLPSDPTPPMRPYTTASFKEIRRCTTSDRVTGRRNKAISSLTTVATAVRRAMAFLNLFRLIGSGIDRPADRSISEIENKTSYISSL
jgi:hypothetical protein